MPTYQYACTACGHQLEAVQSFTDEPLTECPTCAGRLRKLFNSVGIVFKGSGFYRTDSRTESDSGSTAGKPAASNGSGSSSDSTSNDSTSSSSTSTSSTSNGSASSSTTSKSTGASSASSGGTKTPAASSTN
ncbi:FmdB family transcriptional regulator [Salinispora arenicola]|nr:FmdB family transcriptional regulator [Salinispora arenicola]NIL62005.1 FmdB family transcriptional regulator [Salinispora arenicola]